VSDTLHGSWDNPRDNGTKVLARSIVGTSEDDIGAELLHVAGNLEDLIVGRSDCKSKVSVRREGW